MNEGGPASVEELLRLKSRYLIPCVYHFYQHPPHLVGGRGCCVVDSTGREYLDCFCGVTVTSAGHCQPEIIEPAIEQIRRLQHTTSIYLTEPVLRLAEKLAALAPGDLCRSFFTASGSEAVEGALLSAVLHTRRPEVIAASDGLHGRTRWGMNVTGLSLWRTDPFPLETVHHVPFGDVGSLERMLMECEGRVSAFIAEPVQGNGGIHVPPPEYWPAVRRLCDRHGVVLVLDEVQTGFGRTGRWFACEHWNVVPDVLVLSKSLGNGFPIAAFVTTDRIAADYTRPGASTYGGNPVSATAALATIAFHERRALAGRSRELGSHLLAGLAALANRSPRLAAPRGLGLMVGIDLLDVDGRPDAAGLDRLLEALKDRGFLCGKTGADRNVLTFMPPLVIERFDLDRLLTALAEALTTLEMMP